MPLSSFSRCMAVSAQDPTLPSEGPARKGWSRSVTWNSGKFSGGQLEEVSRMVPQNLTSTAEHSRYFGNLFQRIFALQKNCRFNCRYHFIPCRSPRSRALLMKARWPSTEGEPKDSYKSESTTAVYDNILRLFNLEKWCPRLLLANNYKLTRDEAFRHIYSHKNERFPRTSAPDESRMPPLD